MASKSSKQAPAPSRAFAITTKDRKSFRRAGFTFGGGVVFLRESEITPEQLEALQAEPLLVVREVDDTEAKSE